MDSCTGAMDVRGIPTQLQEEGVSAAEVVDTAPAGGKFRAASDTPYKVRGGAWRRRRLGVNALIGMDQDHHLWRDGEEHFMEFRDGEKVAPAGAHGAARVDTAPR